MTMSVRMAIVALLPVTLTPRSMLAARTHSVTAAIDKPTESASLSRIFNCRLRKNTSVQQNPGRKKTRTIPRPALTAGMLSRNGNKEYKKSLITMSLNYPHFRR